MRWFKSGLALAIIFGMLALIRWQTDEETFKIAALAVLIALLAVFVVMDDSHSVWLAKTRNVPAWGQVVAGIGVLALVGPMLWEAIKSAVEAVVGSFEQTRCLLSGALVIALIAFAVLNRRRHNRVRVRPAAPLASPPAE